ncbi:MAG: hypothetical protein J7M20_00365 [Deltaproteobacteria bacterium]|nr:hypothetical protein [Deltaproteobacteria bacterium]
MGLYFVHPRALGIKRSQALSTHWADGATGNRSIFTRHNEAVYGIQIEGMRRNNTGMPPFPVVIFNHYGEFQFGFSLRQKFGHFFIHAIHHSGSLGNALNFVLGLDHSNFANQL